MSDLSYAGIVPDWVASPLTDAGDVVSLNALNLIYWRISRWHVDATITSEATGPGGFHKTASLTLNDDFTYFVNPPGDELEILLNNWVNFAFTTGNGYQYIDVGGGGGISSDAVASQTGCSVGGAITLAQWPVVKINNFFNLFTPVWGGSIPDFNHRLPFTWQDGSLTTAFYGEVSGTVLDTFAGYSVSTTYTCRVTPILWWSFGGHFHTATGLPT